MDIKAIGALVAVVIGFGMLFYYFTEIDLPPSRTNVERAIVCAPPKDGSNRFECSRP